MDDEELEAAIIGVLKKQAKPLCRPRIWSLLLSSGIAVDPKQVVKAVKRLELKGHLARPAYFYVTGK